MTPESDEVYKYPTHTPANSLFPSDDDDRASQHRDPADVSSVHVTPESDEVYKYPPFPTPQ